MKKLLICCLAILLAGVPVCSVSAAAPETTVTIGSKNLSFSMEIDQDLGAHIINSSDEFLLSPDGNSMTTSITMNYQGEVIPARSVEVTKNYGGNIYKGTVYLDSYWYHDGVTTAVYEGTLYLQSSTSTS